MLIDIIISFDHTGSMSAALKQVKSEISKLIKSVFQYGDDLKIGIVVHNDYCDRGDLMHFLNFTNDESALTDFVNRDYVRGGGDAKEAYAYVLHHINEVKWREGAKKIAIVIGDERPHEKGAVSAGVRELYDWKEESRNLGDKGIQIYAIQAFDNSYARDFYQSIANFSNGIRLELSQFSHITDYLEAIFHKQVDKLDEFQASKPQYSTNLSFRNMFNKLRGVSDVVLEKTILEKSELLSRFQVVPVSSAVRIKDFVENMGLHYSAGRGFYEFVNSEIIQANKEVIFVDKETGECIFDTKWCREQMGLPYGVQGKLNPRRIPVSRKYDIFIQSNSYTRKLDPNTKFLYELDLK